MSEAGPITMAATALTCALILARLAALEIERLRQARNHLNQKANDDSNGTLNPSETPGPTNDGPLSGPGDSQLALTTSLAVLGLLALATLEARLGSFGGVRGLATGLMTGLALHAFGLPIESGRRVRAVMRVLGNLVLWCWLASTTALLGWLALWS